MWQCNYCGQIITTPKRISLMDEDCEGFQCWRCGSPDLIAFDPEEEMDEQEPVTEQEIDDRINEYIEWKRSVKQKLIEAGYYNKDNDLLYEGQWKKKVIKDYLTSQDDFYKKTKREKFEEDLKRDIGDMRD